MKPMAPERTASVITAAVAALVSGLLVTAIALAMSGGGHGWNAAFISVSAVVTAPVGTLCWFGRFSRIGHRFAAALVLVNVTIVFVLLMQTAAEGTEYVIRTWQALPGYVVAWAILWFGWQIVPVAAFVSGLKSRRAG